MEDVLLRIALSYYMTEKELINRLYVDVVYFGQENLSKMIGISQSYLSMILAGKRKPGKKVLNYLGFKKEIIYTY